MYVNQLRLAILGRPNTEDILICLEFFRGVGVRCNIENVRETGPDGAEDARLQAHNEVQQQVVVNKALELNEVVSDWGNFDEFAEEKGEANKEVPQQPVVNKPLETEGNIAEENEEDNTEVSQQEDVYKVCSCNNCYITNCPCETNCGPDCHPTKKNDKKKKKNFN